MAFAAKQESIPGMILVMGITGSGKSYFVNKLANRPVARESASLKSCTTKCQLVPAEIGRSRVLLVDTPGFDDTTRSDTEILVEISNVLAAQYQLGVQLKGAIFLHRITDPRFQGSSLKTLNIFKEICGVGALENVVLVTSRWDDVDQALGADRERELRTDFWAYMLSNGSTMTRFYGDRGSAIAIASQLLNKPSVVLDIQRETVDKKKPLNETKAGTLVNESIEGLKGRLKKDLEDLEILYQSQQNERKATKIRQDLEDEKLRLRNATRDQEGLTRDIGREVGDRIQESTGGRKQTGLEVVGLLLPNVIALMGMFLDIPGEDLPKP